MRSKRARAEKQWLEISLILSSRESFLYNHNAAASNREFQGGDLRTGRSWENDDMEQPVFDAGIAGSLTMIFLTAATVVLLRSFYKRWKRMENRRLNDAKVITEPSFIRGNNMEYNSDRDLVFPGGNEARWLDLQSLRLRSDRVQQIDVVDGLTRVIVKPDFSKSQTPYFTFNDLNGAFIISNTESLQSEFQNDYAKVHFTYKPPNGIPYVGEKLYLIGDITQNKLNKESLMQFNVLKGVY